MVVYIMILKKAFPKSSLDSSKRGQKSGGFHLINLWATEFLKKQFEYHLVWLSAPKKIHWNKDSIDTKDRWCPLHSSILGLRIVAQIQISRTKQHVNTKPWQPFKKLSNHFACFRWTRPQREGTFYAIGNVCPWNKKSQFECLLQNQSTN
jgi:hypothetical protein